MQEDKQSIYEHLSEAEDYDDYVQNGYHPVYLGEMFNCKYVVLQKLGWGHFSTVWLVINHQDNLHYALKIQRSKKSHAETALDQLQLLKCINENKNDNKWVILSNKIQMKKYIIQRYSNSLKFQMSENQTFCIQLFDNFSHLGIHGKHYCTVFNIMGPNLLDLIQHYQYNDDRMPIWLVKLITKQILLGLIYIHNSCGMIHTDLKPQNIMIQLSNVEMFVEQLKKYKKKPISMKFLESLKGSNKNKKKHQKKKQKKKKQKQAQEQKIIQNCQSNDKQQTTIIQISSQSKIEEQSDQQQPKIQKQPSQQQIQPQKPQNNQVKKQQYQRHILKWKGLNIQIDQKIKIKLADFGNACWKNKQFTKGIQTRQYRSPQAIIGSGYGTNTDIWSLACLIFQMLTNNFLFKPSRKNGITKSENHLALMMQSLGKMPRSFALSGQWSKEYFNKKGQLMHIKKINEFSIRQQLMQLYQYEQEQAIQIEQFLLPMLQYNPIDRIEGRQILEHPWLWR